MPERRRSVVLLGQRLATLVPISPDFAFRGRDLEPERRYALSRFACLRQVRGEMILESPLAHARILRILLCDWRATALVHALAQPGRISHVVERVPALPAPAAGALARLMLNAGMLAESDDGISTEDDSEALRSWEFHDLLFHARSRTGRHDQPVGGTCRFAGQTAPPPVLKPVRSEPPIPLYRPDMGERERDDPPFAQVQEARRSIREYADRPLSAVELGEFLYRVARVADYWEADVASPHGPVRLAFAPRPYPAPGALFELEFYVAVNAGENLALGLYHYDPEQHGLSRVSGPTAAVEQLLREAGWAARIPAERLQILIILAARFQRIAWKYESIAYSLILKHVGVLYQTMYLVATAMRLAPCAIGCGNADLFARVAGTDYYAEASVGEFLLGSRA